MIFGEVSPALGWLLLLQEGSLWAAAAWDTGTGAQHHHTMWHVCLQ